MENRGSFRVKPGGRVIGIAIITPRLVIGLIVIGLGLVFFLDEMGIVDRHEAWTYWPVALIAVGLVKLLGREAVAARVFGAVIAAAGGLFLLNNLGYIRFRLHD